LQAFPKPPSEIHTRGKAPIEVLPAAFTYNPNRYMALPISFA
jgi:hypothetical protein